MALDGIYRQEWVDKTSNMGFVSSKSLLVDDYRFYITINNKGKIWGYRYMTIYIYVCIQLINDGLFMIGDIEKGQYRENLGVEALEW